MAGYRTNGRARRQVPGAQPSMNGQGSVEYRPVLPGLVACSRCAALVLDSHQARSTHGRFHEGLRELWQRSQ
jgi:hypothetical protein